MKIFPASRFGGWRSLLPLALLLSTPMAYADSATWSASPLTNDWNKAANWVPATIPNGPADTATFDVSSTTNLTFSAVTEVNGITFDSGASAYTFTAKPPVVLTISGAGIVNNSGTTSFENSCWPKDMRGTRSGFRERFS